MTHPEPYLDTFDERDLSIWIEVPQVFPVPGLEEQYPDEAAWGAVMAQAVWDSSALQPTAEHIEVLTRILTYAAENTAPDLPGSDIFLHLPQPMDMPLTVHIGDLDTEDLDEEEVWKEIRELCGPQGPEAVEEPTVEDFASPHLGDGIRVLSYVTDEEDGTINALLRYGWFVPQLRRAVHLSTFALDPGHLLSAMKDIDTLARGIKYVHN